MSYSRILSRASFGIEAPQVAVEVHLSNGLPSLNMVGLANAEVKESKERVRSALINSGFEFPARRITINLAPADLPKTGGRFDLAIAVGILNASDQLKISGLGDYEFMAELGLNGELKPINGALVASHQANQCQRSIWMCEDNAEEASLSGNDSIYIATDLADLVKQLISNDLRLYQRKVKPTAARTGICLSEIRGNDHAKLALCLAAAGGHNMVMIGTPGSGKSMLANSLSGISPDLTDAQAFEVAALESVSQQGFRVERWHTMRIRRPHHSCTQVAMAGGGKMPTPGEISLAHHGVLFLDELPEFNKTTLECLRQPMEDRQLTVSRSNWKVTFPANFQLIAAMNPCPCGYLTSTKTACRCSETKIKSYLAKLSGPLLDRIDIQVMVNECDETILEPVRNSSLKSKAVRHEVERLRLLQYQRQRCLNADLDSKRIPEVKVIDKSANTLFLKAVDQFNLSMRTQQKVLRLALTISDWHGQGKITKNTIVQSLSYRAFDTIHDKLAKGFVSY